MAMKPKKMMRGGPAKKMRGGGMVDKKMRGGGMVKKMEKGGASGMSVAQLRKMAKDKGYKLVKG
jgi:hypothetical protein